MAARKKSPSEKLPPARTPGAPAGRSSSAGRLGAEGAAVRSRLAEQMAGGNIEKGWELPAVPPPRLEGVVVRLTGPAPVTQMELLRAFLELRKRHGTATPLSVGEQVQLGDDLVVSYVTRLDQKPTAFGAAVHAPLSILPQPPYDQDLGNQLVGKKVTDVVTVALKLPADHPVASCRGRTAAVGVHILAGTRYTLPAEDSQAFLQAAGPYASVEEALKALSTQLTEHHAEAFQQEVTARVYDALSADVQVPEDTLNRVLQAAWHANDGRLLLALGVNPSDTLPAMEAWKATPATRGCYTRLVKHMAVVAALAQAHGLTLSSQNVVDNLADVVEMDTPGKARLTGILERNPRTLQSVDGAMVFSRVHALVMNAVKVEVGVLPDDAGP